MAKTLKQVLNQYRPKAKDEQDFADKHEVEVTDDANKNGDEVFKGTKVKTVERSKTRHGYDVGADEKVYEEVEQVEEKLGAGANAGDYIKDFEKSDAPQFAGKSKEKRRKMALAAFLNKESVNYAEETLDEEVDVTLLALYAQLDEANQEIMVKMIDDGRKEELYQFLEAIEE